MYGKFYIDNMGLTLFEGEYYESEIQGMTMLFSETHPKLYQNHVNSKSDIAAMTKFIRSARRMLGIERTETAGSDIAEAEIRLGASLPEALTALYTAIDGDYGFVLDTKNKYKLLRPDEIFIRNGVAAFACRGKRKKYYLGLGLEEQHVFYWEEFDPCHNWEYDCFAQIHSAVE